MNILYQLLMTILKIIGSVASFFNLDYNNTIERFIRDFENKMADTKEKYHKSAVAAKEWKNDELKKIYKKRDELELRYFGKIVDSKKYYERCLS